jgi:NitT/TauT family transport system ATP-binding protein
VRLEGVSIAYRVGGRPSTAVEGAEAIVPDGALCAIIGPSGCGKTSIVQAMAGLLAPSAGRVLVAGEKLSGVRERTALIFQDYGLLPWKTAEANAELPLLLRRAPKRRRREIVRPLLEELGLADFASFYPARLSGGMRQRLAVARALASGPDLLLMDEPFSSLDALTREAMQETLLEVRRRHGTTTVMVTHSIEEAAYLADLILVMRGRNPGRIEASLETGRPAGAGSEYRGSARYIELTLQLRRALEGANAVEDAGTSEDRR